MKVKEKMWDGRGRPRKFQPGEAVEWRLRAPDNLLMELRICARAGNRSVNEEIIARLLLSLNYQPGKPVIKTAEGERLIALAVRFEEWLGQLLDGESLDDAGEIKSRPSRSNCGCGVRVKEFCFRGKQPDIACEFLKTLQMKSGQWRRCITVV
jgi:hypothetical protein